MLSIIAFSVNAYSHHLAAGRWMTAKRGHFSLVCLPPHEGGLIAIGGYNGDFIDVVECLDGEDAADWRRLTPLPLPLASPCVCAFSLSGVEHRAMPKPQPLLHLLPRPQEALANGSP